MYDTTKLSYKFRSQHPNNSGTNRGFMYFQGHEIGF